MAKDWQDRGSVVSQNFRQCVLSRELPHALTHTTPKQANLTKEQFLDLFESQLLSRHIDLQARILRERNLGFYTIGSSGHESNCAVALSLQLIDRCFLHYRSGAFILQRAKMAGIKDPVYSQLLGIVASKTDPCSGGRHKVVGSKELNIPPQTSTIASHLPKALGSAYSITLSKTAKDSVLPFASLAHDSIIVCSFGDASLNHSTAQGALNSASWILHKSLSLPILFICEDNGFGISVPTPEDWVYQTMKAKVGIEYVYADGANLADVYAKSVQAVSRARHGQPVFLHIKMVRLLGHAGSDIEIQYRSLDEIEQTERQDPLLHSARIILENGWLSSEEILALYDNKGKEVQQCAEKAILAPPLLSAMEVMAPIIPPKSAHAIPSIITEEKRKKGLGSLYDTTLRPRNMAQCINLALADILLQYPEVVVFGEDVGKKGGVYQVTKDLQSLFGPKRVFDTLLDEQTILGTAIGFAQNGFIPLPEIQFLAYVHNAEDQIRGEAATLSFFSNGQFTNPMVIRIPGLAYQKGFGGHYHNDNAIAFLREIPGLIIACPSSPMEAALLLRECVRLAHEEQRVVIFLEPIALYMVKDKYVEADNQFLVNYSPPGIDQIRFREIGIEGQGLDLAIISYGNGHYLSKQAVQELEVKHKVKCRLVDLRWLAPLNPEALLKAVATCSAILIVDECRETGSLSEQLMTMLVECKVKAVLTGRIGRVTAMNSFIPIGNAWQYLLPSKQSIIEKALTVLQQSI